MLKVMGKIIFYNFTLNFFVYLNLCSRTIHIKFTQTIRMKEGKAKTKKFLDTSKQVLWQTVKTQMHNAAFHQGLHCFLR